MKRAKTKALIGSLSILLWAVPATVLAADACDNTTTSDALQKCVKNNQIVQDLQTIVNALSIGVGVVIVAMIMLGGIQYMAAGDNPSAVTAAKQRISNALLALFAFLLIYAFVQW